METTQIYAVDQGTGAESLQVRSVDVPTPPAEQARVRVEAAGVSYGDLLFQRGIVPGGPRPPFVPGCDLTGVVESVGTGVAGLQPGMRVAALVVSGGYSSVRNIPARRLVPVPTELAAVDAAAVALNYFIAHQMLHRVARVRPGQRIVVHGASGGVGLAFLQLVQLIGGVTVWGTCSAANAELVRGYGAIPVDYRSEDFVAVVKAAGGNVDAVFDPIGGSHFRRSYKVLRPGGRLVAYGQSAALRDGKNSRRIGAAGFFGGIVAPKLVPDGRKAGFYNAWALEKSAPAAYREDLTEVLALRSEGKISPRSVTVIPLQEAARAFQELEKGTTGKIVLDCTG